MAECRHQAKVSVSLLSCAPAHRSTVKLKQLQVITNPSHALTRKAVLDSIIVAIMTVHWCGPCQGPALKVATVNPCFYEPAAGAILLVLGLLQAVWQVRRLRLLERHHFQPSVQSSGEQVWKQYAMRQHSVL